MDEIERLLQEAEEDVLAASDAVIGLTTRFGSDQLLLELIAECNLRRQQVALHRSRLSSIKASLTAESLVELQLILAQVTELRSACNRAKQLAEELKRND